MFKKFSKNKSGATAIEYVLIAAAMATVLVTMMPKVTTSIKKRFTTIDTGIKTSK
ncbi:MAG: Flp family type IVb pilin [Aestuariivirga sp.]